MSSEAGSTPLHGLDIGGKPAIYFGLSVLDPERLFDALPIGHLWDQKVFEAARDADVHEWLEAEQASARWSVPGSRELVAETLRAAGLDTFHGLWRATDAIVSPVDMGRYPRR
jgi:hypothetical protein